MTSGKIQYAETNGTFVFKFIGDIRLTLSTLLDKKLERLLEQPGIKSLVIDLSDTQAIDSTSLGLLARLSIKTKAQLDIVPTIFSPNDDINRILLGMGFDQILVIVHEIESSGMPAILQDLPLDEEGNEQEVMDKVIIAHKVLMDMNEHNQQEFQDLLQQLEKNKTTPSV